MVNAKRNHLQSGKPDDDKESGRENKVKLG